MFPVYGGKCLSRKAVQIWANKFSQERSMVTDDARLGGEVAETTAECFDGLEKRCDKFITVGGGYGEKYMFFPGLNITCFAFYIQW
jgi:hypothetical protein